MNKSVRSIIIICFCVLLPLMTLFASVGYAAITAHLTISGEAEYNEPATVFITDVKVSSSNNVTGTPTVTKAGFVVFQHNQYTLNTQRGSNTPGGSVTIEVTVKNNSDVGQYFVGHTIEPQLSRNVVVSFSNITVGTLLAHGETKTFYINIQNTSYYNTFTVNQSESTLNFSPNFDESFTQDASENLATVFSNVLEGKGIDGEGKGIVYQGREVPANRIMDTLTSTMENVDTGGYIGNVGNASQAQKDLIEAIFGENILMQIGNQHYSVSILIKNQQIDGRGQNDMVMYVTADQLAIGSGNWSNGAWRNLNIVPVYGIVFINNNGSYSYCDHLFMGEAPVCNFGGAFGAGNVGNFNTNLWNSTEYANLTDTSNGVITQDYITKDGELDEAYRRYVNG